MLTRRGGGGGGKVNNRDIQIPDEVRQAGEKKKVKYKQPCVAIGYYKSYINGYIKTHQVNAVKPNTIRITTNYDPANEKTNLDKTGQRKTRCAI